MRTLLMDAIRGVGFPTYGIADDFEKAGLARFVGNQHNADWVWVPDKLEAMTEDRLQQVYETLRNAREAEHARLREIRPKILLNSRETGRPNAD